MKRKNERELRRDAGWRRGVPEMPQLPLPLSVDTLLISPPAKGCLLFLQK